MERWLSGRKRHTANVLTLNRVPGFESLPLRTKKIANLICNFFNIFFLFYKILRLAIIKIEKIKKKLAL